MCPQIHHQSRHTNSCPPCVLQTCSAPIARCHHAHPPCSAAHLRTSPQGAARQGLHDRGAQGRRGKRSPPPSPPPAHKQAGRSRNTSGRRRSAFSPCQEARPHSNPAAPHRWQRRHIPWVPQRRHPGGHSAPPAPSLCPVPPTAMAQPPLPHGPGRTAPPRDHLGTGPTGAAHRPLDGETEALCSYTMLQACTSLAQSRSRLGSGTRCA